MVELKIVGYSTPLDVNLPTLTKIVFHYGILSINSRYTKTQMLSRFLPLPQ